MADRALSGKVKRYSERVLHEWGVAKNELEVLGGAWFTETFEWPKRFRTRREAQVAARELETKFLYLRPAGHVWKFRPVRLTITVRYERG